MSVIKIYRFLSVVMLCGTSLTVAVLGLITHQTQVKQQGNAVLFFADHQGQLREAEVNPIIFNQVSVNKGSAYDNRTGVFTVPVSGVYQFMFSAQLCRGDHNNRWSFMVNGMQRLLCHAQVSGQDTTLNTCHYMVELQRGNKVWIRHSRESCAWASLTSKTIVFSGVLLARDGLSMLGQQYNPGSSCPLSGLSLYKGSGSTAWSPNWGGMVIAVLLHHLMLE